MEFKANFEISTDLAVALSRKSCSVDMIQYVQKYLPFKKMNVWENKESRKKSRRAWFQEFAWKKGVNDRAKYIRS